MADEIGEAGADRIDDGKVRGAVERAPNEVRSGGGLIYGGRTEIVKELADFVEHKVNRWIALGGHGDGAGAIDGAERVADDAVGLEGQLRAVNARVDDGKSRWRHLEVRG